MTISPRRVCAIIFIVCLWIVVVVCVLLSQIVGTKFSFTREVVNPKLFTDGFSIGPIVTEFMMLGPNLFVMYVCICVCMV